jgi:pimeloyl-ACP methyl ester carboxylesterase
MASQGPLANQASILNIAKNLWRARERLHLRTGQDLPTAGQLAVALRLYILAEDRRRAESQLGVNTTHALAAGVPFSADANDADLLEPNAVSNDDAYVDANTDSALPCSLDAAILQHSTDRLPMPDSTPSLTIEQLFGQMSPESEAEPSAPYSSLDGHMETNARLGVSQRQLAMELRHYLLLADSAYASSEAESADRLAFLGGTDALLEARWTSSSCHPAYCIVHDALNSTIVVAVRGSKEASDFITNLSCDTDPFMSGYGHSGMIQAAKNLAGVLHNCLFEYLERLQPANGLVLVGHSLGGAVAALLAIMLRTNTFEENAASGVEAPVRLARWTRSARSTSDGGGTNTSDVVQELGQVQSQVGGSAPVRSARNVSARTGTMASEARCFTFGCPPCISPELALLSKSQGLFSFIFGLDMVPRLSAASLDRFLLSVSRYDWPSEASQSLERTFANIATPALGVAGAATAASLLAQYAPTGLAWMANSAGSSARRALASHPAQASRSGSAAGALSATRALSPSWKIALTVTAIASTVISNQFFREDSAHVAARASRDPGSRRQPDYAFARRFGLSAEDVEQVLLSNQPEELRVPGRIFHLNRTFNTTSEETGLGACAPSVRIVERNADSFLDVEASGWMLYDHHPPHVAQALDNLIQPNSV